MNHQFFETLLLSDTKPTDDEAVILQEHLITCDTCRQLSNALSDMEVMFHNSALASPRPGFTQRWEEKLALDTEKRQRRQVVAIAIISACSIAALLLLLGFALWPIFISPISVLWAKLINFVSWFSAVEAALDIVSTLLRVTYSVVPASLWIALSVAFLGLCAIWVVAIKQVISPRRLAL